MSSDIVKDSHTLKQALIDRWKEIGISHVMIAKDSQKFGVKGITPNSISKYIHNSYQKSALNQYQILFLCWRYGIKVTLKVGEPIVENGKLKYIVPQPFNEEKALADLYLMFPTIKKPRKKK